MLSNKGRKTIQTQKIHPIEWIVLCKTKMTKSAPWLQVFNLVIGGRSAKKHRNFVARNTSQSQMCELSREPPKLILRFGEPLCDFAATRYAPVHKFHLANRTSLQARALGVSLIARRTPFSQSEKRRANTARRPKRRKNEGSNIPSFFLWSKWRYPTRTTFKKCDKALQYKTCWACLERSR